MAAGDLEPRVDALEEQVRNLTNRVQASEQDAAAARVLAGAADRDGSEIRGELRDFRKATTAGFNTLRQDFVDLRQDFVDLRTHVDQGFMQVEQGFIEMRGKLDSAAAGQRQIVDLLQTIITNPDETGSDPE